MLPHTHSLDQTAQQLQGEVFRPDLPVKHLDDSGKRYLMDVTTVDVSSKTYRTDASRSLGRQHLKRKRGKPLEYRTKADANMTGVFKRPCDLMLKTRHPKTPSGTNSIAGTRPPNC